MKKSKLALMFVAMASITIAVQSQNTPVRFTHVNRDMEKVQEFYQKMYVPARDTPEGWKELGNCNPGSPSPAALKARLTEINFFRQMAGLKPVTFDPAYNQKAQAAAHLMLKNGALSHNPPTSWKCYSAEAASGAGSSNLGYGGGILGYITDYGSSNQSCGHRMYILEADAAVMGYGGTGITDAIYVFGKDAEYDSIPKYVAWPPAGFVPSEILGDRWTFSVPNEDVDYEDATATLTVNGARIPLTYTQETTYGDGGIAFEIADWYTWKSKIENQHVKVQIQNVVVGDQVRAYSYEVVSFPAEAAPVFVSTNGLESEDENAVDEVEAEPELAFADRMPATLAELASASELQTMTVDMLKQRIARDLVADASICKFATKIATLRKEKNPDAERLQAWAEGRLKQHLAQRNAVDETQLDDFAAPKFILVEFKQLIPLNAETYADISKEWATKFAEKPEVKAFATRYRRSRQCGVGFAIKRVDRNGKTYAGVYATLVIAPATLVAI